MTKVFIRTRQIDNNKQLPILIRENDDLSDFNEYSNVSRGSQILSGMDKVEESEHHLQKALQELHYEKSTANTAIPIPEVYEEYGYEKLYKSDFILPKNYIRLKTLEFEDESPEYDLDEEDQEWLDNSKLDVTCTNFEKIIGEFERACSQKALLLDEAKCLLRNEPMHIVIAVYDYWLTKRVRSGQPLHISVKAEKAERSNNTPIDAYIAFRKRSEKMMTRKNRRVDELSYERMYRLSCHMEKLSATIELVYQREITKRLISQAERDIFIQRCQSRDYNKLSNTNLKIHQPLRLLDNFKLDEHLPRDNSHKDICRKRPYSLSSLSTMNGVDVTWDQSNPDVDIDFTFRPMAKCKYVSSKLTSVHSHHTSPTGSINQQNNHFSHNSLPRRSHLDVYTQTRLYTLYIQDINCGLPSLSLHPPPLWPSSSCHQTTTVTRSPRKSLTSSYNYMNVSRAPQSTPIPQTTDININVSPGKRPLSDHNTVDDNHHRHHHNTAVTVAAKRAHSLQSQDHTNPSAQQHHTLSIHQHVNHHNGDLCTYQNNPSQCLLNSDHQISKQYRPFTESDHNHRPLFGQKLSPTVIKELVDNPHSLNGAYPTKLSQIVGLNCLKSLTNKRLIDRDDHFYSKSNGHNLNHSYQRQQQKKWLNQKTVDNCLKSTTRLPLWSTEPHVMTSVNKMA